MPIINVGNVRGLQGPKGDTGDAMNPDDFNTMLVANSDYIQAKNDISASTRAIEQSGNVGTDTEWYIKSYPALGIRLGRRVYPAVTVAGNGSSNFSIQNTNDWFGINNIFGMRVLFGGGGSAVHFASVYGNQLYIRNVSNTASTTGNITVTMIGSYQP